MYSEDEQFTGACRPLYVSVVISCLENNGNSEDNGDIGDEDEDEDGVKEVPNCSSACIPMLNACGSF
jgi:hypothetical protein